MLTTTTTTRTAAAAAATTMMLLLLLALIIHTVSGFNQELLQQYVSHVEQRYEFQLQPWRWHSLSVVRELRAKDEIKLEYVTEFNLQGLQDIQTNTFFPWLKDTVFERIPDVNVKQAFNELLTHIVREQDRARFLMQAMRATKSDKARQSLIDIMEELVTAQSYFVPLIRAHVSAFEQSKMNLFILSGLGILDSRVFLCGMHGAAVEAGEEDLFSGAIPYFVRIMIPRWKRLLYEPRSRIEEKPKVSDNAEEEEL